MPYELRELKNASKHVADTRRQASKVYQLNGQH